jgi:hypothetical protein
LKDLEIKIRLEALITRRCMMISMNNTIDKQRPPVYSYEPGDFKILEQEMLDLAKIARDSD